MIRNNRSTHSVRTPMATGLGLIVGLVALSATAALAQGPEQTAKLTKTVQSTVKSIDATRLQLEKTVAGYNSIMDQTAKDTKDAYKGLGKNITESEKKVAEARLKVDEMNAEADRLFTAWQGNTAAITDSALRTRSEERLADSQARFQKVADAGKETRQTFDTLMTDLKNQSTYLGNDLNAGAIASLKPDAAKFNTRAKGLFDQIDGVNKMFGDYVASMTP
jgi:uncharacterized membrane-anchored protein YhcB (DUF1043 family)